MDRSVSTYMYSHMCMCIDSFCYLEVNLGLFLLGKVIFWNPTREEVSVTDVPFT